MNIYILHWHMSFQNFNSLSAKWLTGNCFNMRFRKLKEARKKWRSNKLTLNVLPWFSGFQKYKMLSAKLTPCMSGVSGELIGWLKGAQKELVWSKKVYFCITALPCTKLNLLVLVKRCYHQIYVTFRILTAVCLV